MKSFFTLTTLFFCSIIFAQDATVNAVSDSLYREDQFYASLNYNLLQKSKLQVIGEVYLSISQNLLVYPGVKLNEIKEVLTGMSLYLGMEIPNWPPDNIAEMSKKLEEQI